MAVRIKDLAHGANPKELAEQTLELIESGGFTRAVAGRAE
jgi:hypothetical protein